ncbi:MAG: AI-2E family transporter [Crocinitomicaceae bacterium]|nr:AI-2E family transporter [Crocinitomicaceae bacterium]
MNFSIDKIALLLLALALLISGLILGKVVLVPIVFAALFTFGLTPVCNRLERIGLNRVFAIITTFLVITLLITSIVLLFSITFANIYDDLPEIQSKIDASLANIETEVSNWFGVEQDNLEAQIMDNQSKLLAPIWEFLQNSLGSTLTSIGNAFLCLFYTFLLLYYRKGLVRVFTKNLNHESKVDKLELISRLKIVIRDYFKGLLIVIILLSVVNSLGLLIIGIDYPVFFGVLAGFLVVIPYIGTTLGGILPFLYALATTGTMWQPSAVVIMYFTIQQLEGNFITPNVVGSRIKVNALTIIVGMIIGGLIWGLSGIVLALPVIAVCRNIFIRYDKTQLLGLLMSDDLGNKD